MIEASFYLALSLGTVVSALVYPVFSSTRRRDLLLQTLAVVGLYLGVVSVLSMVGPQRLVFPRYIMDYLANSPMAKNDPRAVGPFLSSEANGMALALCAFAAALLWIRTRNAGWRALVLITIPASTAGLILTLTRSSWLAAVLGVVLVGLFVPGARRWLALVAVLGTAALGAILVGLWLWDRAARRPTHASPRRS